MLALQTMAFVTILGTILAIIVFFEGERKFAGQILKAVYGSVGMLLFLILLIGMAPMPR